MNLEEYEILALREVISNFQPESASMAARPMPLSELYAPATHKDALDIEKPLIVGNRGTGKSVWSGALADPDLRKAIAGFYADESLKNAEVELGFHQSAAEVRGIAPSSRVLSSLLKNGQNPETIWTAVLLQATVKYTKARIKSDLGDLIKWIDLNPSKSEDLLRKADEWFLKKGKKFLLVFDALDRLGASWGDIRPLSRGILVLALNMQGYSSMRAKIFMRTDQFKDNTVFNFPDASKLKAACIELKWHSTDLFGLFFKQFTNHTRSNAVLERLYKDIEGKPLRPYSSLTDPDLQRQIFKVIAGEYMGTDHRRGRTYTWIIDHLADAFHETTPRSFLVTLQRAARARQKPMATVIDHHGIREGVQAASAIRVDQLAEDYPWISRALTDLEGLEVPCTPSMFVNRWKSKQTVSGIDSISVGAPGPVELENSLSDKEELLLESLVNIGVIEYRSETKINMPDIFRVAAKIKRRGGVKPPSFSRTK